MIRNRYVWGAALGLLALGAVSGLPGGRPGVAPVAAASNDWPMYGYDAQRTSYNPTETRLSRDTLAQVAPRWQSDIGSNGIPPSGAPTVAGGRVYVGSSRADGDNFFAFDAQSGARAWSARVGHIEVPCFNIGIGATAAVAGNLVVAGGGDGAYYGLDATTGAQKWRHALNVGSSGFPWASPLITGGRVYVGVSSRCDDPSVRGEVRILDLAGGTVLANRYLEAAGQAGAGIWNSPTLSPDGTTLVLATGEDYRGNDGPYNRAIVTLDAASLQILQVDKEGATGHDLDYGSTPVIFHDSQNRTLVGANHKNGTFYAFTLGGVNAGPLWSRATGTTVGMMPAYDPAVGAGGTLFITGSGGRLFAVDPATGQDRWGPLTVGPMHGNLAIANGLVFANTGSTGVKVLDAATGELLRTLLPANAGSAYSGVAVADGAVYWLSGSYLNVWSLPASPAPTATVPAGPHPFADPAFAQVWTRTDSRVASHAASRSWLWGPAPNTAGLTEPYREGTGGTRLVQYFDKSRMEINHPAADKNAPFYVTNGLLVVEMIAGRMQIGDTAYQSRPPATIPVAGDAGDPAAPTYASFVGVANSPVGDHRAPDRTGQFVTATLSRAGSVGDDPAKRQYAGLDLLHYEAGVGHNIPRIFWAFLNQQGPVVENGRTVTGPLSNPWFYASGLPISEAYWARVQIGGQPHDVLIQAFERRVLTYTPDNRPPFEVEMGNVGQHYYLWRYGSGGASR